ncbi:MAG TPA: hypothetical protein VG273_11815 [Bryobacteraceae bacterium]|jgi:hypothetical protein|nr:hypothetical protein [Bryobacteraceae bacterium]
MTNDTDSTSTSGAPAVPAVPHPAASPDHPAHRAFNWGLFLGLLTVALQATGQAMSPSHPAVGAALAGGAQVLGSVDQTLIEAQAAQ